MPTDHSLSPIGMLEIKGRAGSSGHLHVICLAADTAQLICKVLVNEVFLSKTRGGSQRVIYTNLLFVSEPIL